MWLLFLLFFQLIHIQQIFSPPGKAFAFDEVVEVNKIDWDALKNYFLPKLETFFEGHAFQVQNQVNAVGFISDLDDVRRVQKIRFSQAKRPKAKIVDGLEHPGGVFGRSPNPEIDVFGSRDRRRQNRPRRGT